MSPSERPLPRPFSYPWGRGHIAEEVSYTGRYHEPAIQLLEYDEGEVAGRWAVRFCFYNLEGRFQRSPLMLDEDGIDGLRAALAEAPRLRSLLRRLVAED